MPLPTSARALFFLSIETNGLFISNQFFILLHPFPRDLYVSDSIPQSTAGILLCFDHVMIGRFSVRVALSGMLVGHCPKSFLQKESLCRVPRTVVNLASTS